jgi:hypothetical protein
MHRLLHTSGVAAAVEAVEMAAGLVETAPAAAIVFLLWQLQLVTSCFCLWAAVAEVEALGEVPGAELQVPVTLDEKYLLLEI